MVINCFFFLVIENYKKNNENFEFSSEKKAYVVFWIDRFNWILNVTIFKFNFLKMHSFEIAHITLNLLKFYIQVSNIPFFKQNGNLAVKNLAVKNLSS